MSRPVEIADRAVLALRRLSRNDQVVLSLLAVAVGAMAAGAAIAFRATADLVQRLGFGFAGERVATLAGQLPWWQLLLVPAVGGLAIGIFVHFFMPHRRPHGVADVIEANALGGGRMSLSVGLKAALVSAASIGAGASVGREGPVVHLGAALGAWAARRLHLPRSLSRTLLGCGVAAAIAASFNAPIAGAFFALEVVIGNYAVTAFAPVVVASVVGTMISRAHYGDYPAFILPELPAIASFWEFPGFAVLGVVCAIAAIVFMRSVKLTEDTLERAAIPYWARPALGGLAVGAIAISFPQVLGIGYEATDAALSELFPLWLLLALVVLKTAATALSLGSGFGGGVFSPSLFIGAMVGGAYGILATGVFPHLSSGHGAYTIIGMGAMAGAVLGAPISTILMVFELTNDYAVTVAVMISTSIASIITQQVHGYSFFTWQLHRRGVAVKGGQDVGLVHAIRVRSLLNRDFETVRPDAPMAEVRRRLGRSPWGEIFVVREDGRLTGAIAISDLSEVAFDTGRDGEITAADVARANPPTLCADDDLETAVTAFSAGDRANLPVVDEPESMRMLGVVREHRIVLAYHRALGGVRAGEQGES